jgi:hypothetical protein
MILAKPIVACLVIACVFSFVSCIDQNTDHTTAKHQVSSKSIVGTIASIDLPRVTAGAVVLYDKDKLPSAIKEYYSKKWEGFYMANPNEDWDAGCSGGMAIIDSPGKNGKKYERTIHIKPNTQLVSITTDTVAGTYIVVYNFGGIASGQNSDYFKVSKDGSLAEATSLSGR